MRRMGKEKAEPGISSILVIRPDHLGDLLFVTPALRRLRSDFPASRITALVGPWGESVVACSPYVDEVMVCRFPGFRRAAKGSWLEPYRILWYDARVLRARRFDLAFVLRFDHWWGALLAALAGIPRRVGYDIAEVRPCLTQAVPYVAGRHEVIQNLTLVNEVAKRAGEETTWREEPLEFAPSAADEAWAQEYLASRGGKRWIAIHAGAGAAVKQWRAAAWATVGNALASRHNAGIVLTGSTEERPRAAEIARGLHAPTLIAAGETTLSQLAALLGRCRLALGPDSGPLHLAVAVGTPTVHLYGPASAVIFGPWGDPARHRVVTSDWACIPCNRLDYAKNEILLHGCVRDITVEQVVATAEEVLTNCTVRSIEEPPPP
ncbi:MAG: glycosyltransferase family 9 protein [Anaerolineae bacterium]|nr:glycosyltransferase family 9 protein [Anaerolineae bacterium]